MAVQVYRKKPARIYRPKNRSEEKKRFQRRIVLLHRLAPLFLVGIGVFLLSTALIPIALSSFSSQNTLQADASDAVGTVSRQPEQLLPTPKPTPVVVARELSYIDLRNWFPNQEVFLDIVDEEKTYSIDIPKLGIQNAKVVVGGQELDKHLIHYPKTAYPGEKGSAVVFGHSVLRAFFNPKETNARRYISIFSTIMTLQKGDVILVRDDSVVYTYRVVQKEEVSPTDPKILAQNNEQSELKLITCTPEGTTLRRGIVTAILDDTM